MRRRGQPRRPSSTAGEEAGNASPECIENLVRPLKILCFRMRRPCGRAQVGVDHVQAVHLRCLGGERPRKGIAREFAACLDELGRLPEIPDSPFAPTSHVRTVAVADEVSHIKREFVASLDKLGSGPNANRGNRENPPANVMERALHGPRFTKSRCVTVLLNIPR